MSKYIFIHSHGSSGGAVPIRFSLRFLLDFYDFFPQVALQNAKLRLMRVLIIFMLLCSALSKNFLIETKDKEADDQVLSKLKLTPHQAQF